MNELAKKIADVKNTPLFHTVIDSIAGPDFKIKLGNGKWKPYINKSGKKSVGFFCPFCDFASNRSQNLKVHIKTCPYVEKPKLKEKATKSLQIPYQDIKLDPEELFDEINNLLVSMREINDIKMLGDERQRYVGALAWKFRNNFIPNSMFKNKNWDKFGLDKAAKEAGDNQYYDQRFAFAFIEQDIPVSCIGINDIIPFLVKNFKSVFLACYKMLEKEDFSPPVWYWHRVLFGKNHPQDREYIDLSNQDLVIMPEEGSSQWQKDQIEMVNKSKPVYAC